MAENEGDFLLCEYCSFPWTPKHGCGRARVDFEKKVKKLLTRMGKHVRTTMRERKGRRGQSRRVRNPNPPGGGGGHEPGAADDAGEDEPGAADEAGEDEPGAVVGAGGPGGGRGRGAGGRGHGRGRGAGGRGRGRGHGAAGRGQDEPGEAAWAGGRGRGAAGRGQDEPGAAAWAGGRGRGAGGRGRGRGRGAQAEVTCPMQQSWETGLVLVPSAGEMGLDLVWRVGVAGGPMVHWACGAAAIEHFICAFVALTTCDQFR